MESECTGVKGVLQSPYRFLEQTISQMVDLPIPKRWLKVLYSLGAAKHHRLTATRLSTVITLHKLVSWRRMESILKGLTGHMKNFSPLLQ